MHKTTSATNNLGLIRSRHTWAKLSCVQDQYRVLWYCVHIRGYDTQEEDGEREIGEVEGEGEDDWIWKAKDDFTVGHVWPEGGDLKRGCIYVHSIAGFIGQ
jgi:hypothetical protein